MVLHIFEERSPNIDVDALPRCISLLQSDVYLSAVSSAAECTQRRKNPSDGPHGDISRGKLSNFLLLCTESYHGDVKRRRYVASAHLLHEK
jgi:hypothetical protein